MGLQVHKKLKYRECIQDNEKSLLKGFTTRLNALKQMKEYAIFKQRLAFANGIFFSKVIFLIGVWGGAEDYLRESIQIIVNKAMRVVCKVRKSVLLKDLQKMTN